MEDDDKELVIPKKRTKWNNWGPSATAPSRIGGTFTRIIFGMEGDGVRGREICCSRLWTRLKCGQAKRR